MAPKRSRTCRTMARTSSGRLTSQRIAMGSPPRADWARSAPNNPAGARDRHPRAVVDEMVREHQSQASRAAGDQRGLVGKGEASRAAQVGLRGKRSAESQSGGEKKVRLFHVTWSGGCLLPCRKRALSRNGSMRIYRERRRAPACLACRGAPPASPQPPRQRRVRRPQARRAGGDGCRPRKQVRARPRLPDDGAHRATGVPALRLGPCRQPALEHRRSATLLHAAGGVGHGLTGDLHVGNRAHRPQHSADPRNRCSACPCCGSAATTFQRRRRAMADACDRRDAALRFWFNRAAAR